MILKHLDKNNLHHIYLIEGNKEDVLPDIFLFLKDLGINTSQNPDFNHISIDSFNIEDARNLKSFALEKPYLSQKKIFLISINNILLEAQNSLLKIFEEPIENTHFFIIIPDINSLLKTFISRCYLISCKSYFQNKNKEIQEFVFMSPKDRIDFLKIFLKEDEDKDIDKNEILVLDSVRSKSLKFLNELEYFLHKEMMSKGTFGIAFDVKIDFFEHFLKVRKFLRMSGSSPKILMESIALIIPIFKN